VETITFYSYKGCTGRSLLLANTARFLVALGYRVVILDFDFEAPGLHYKFSRDLGQERLHPGGGVVDYLLASVKGEDTNLRDHLIEVPFAESEGALYLMPAGAAPGGEYWRALTALQRLDLFGDPEGEGIAACLELKLRIQEEWGADFLLIDSRTGVTELAGVTTTVLADKVVCLMLQSLESQEGARAVLQSLQCAARLPDQTSIEIFPVLSRLPIGNVDEESVRQVLNFLNAEQNLAGEGPHFEKIYCLNDVPGTSDGDPQWNVDDLIGRHTLIAGCWWLWKDLLQPEIERLRVLSKNFDLNETLSMLERTPGKPIS
jgi:cellulose biosynthesis protein BcsQ